MSCPSVCLSHLIYTLANVAALSLCQALLITNEEHMQSVREVSHRTLNCSRMEQVRRLAPSSILLARGMHPAISNYEHV